MRAKLAAFISFIFRGRLGRQSETLGVFTGHNFRIMLYAMLCRFLILLSILVAIFKNFRKNQSSIIKKSYLPHILHAFLYVSASGSRNDKYKHAWVLGSMGWKSTRGGDVYQRVAPQLRLRRRTEGSRLRMVILPGLRTSALQPTKLSIQPARPVIAKLYYQNMNDAAHA